MYILTLCIKIHTLYTQAIYIFHKMHIHNSIPDVPKFLMTVRNPGIDSSTLTPNDNGKNSTSPYGLSLADSQLSHSCR